MQLLLLAAGMGKRLRRFTEDNTKCMVKVNNKRIIDYMFEAVEIANESNQKIERIVIVTGYQGDKLKTYINDKYGSLSADLVFIHNPDYDSTNNIYSLWLAKEYLMADDTLLLESDIVFDRGLLNDLIIDTRPNLAVVDKYAYFMDGTMTLLDEDDQILSFVPKKEFQYKSVDKYFKTVNIYKLSADFCKTYYLPFLNAYIEAYGHNEYYEQVLGVIAFLPDTGLKAFRMESRKWYEIDNAQDLDIASQIFAEGERKYTDLTRRYGGYWRFPEVLDFCYLVNPYFPDKGYLDELMFMYEVLLRNYPGGLSVQNMLASEMFQCEEEKILVGNGAAELINALLQNCTGSVGVVFPSFNEYAERVRGDLVSLYPGDRESLSYTAKDLISWSEKVESLVLINPDNPTGNFIASEDMIPVLDHFYRTGKKLIIDESFIDFAGESEAFSLIRDDILDKYSNLTVIRSISKSYGVPGLRLGVLASSDEETIIKVRKSLSIWNINSFAEFFLQTFTKHEKNYLASCQQIAQDREKLFTELSLIKGIRPLPSRANYITFEISGATTNFICENLLHRFNILVKDLTGKNGIPESRGFLRVAVRNEDDNQKLVKALKAVIEG